MIYWNGPNRLGARVTAHCERPDVDVVQQQGHAGQRASRLSAARYWGGGEEKKRCTWFLVSNFNPA